jgi:hypothetical protein
MEEIFFHERCFIDLATNLKNLFQHTGIIAQTANSFRHRYTALLNGTGAPRAVHLFTVMVH